MVRWSYIQNELPIPNTAAANAVWIKDVDVGSLSSLSESEDKLDSPWRTSQDSSWFPLNTPLAKEGLEAIAAPTIEPNESSWIETDLPASSGTLRFSAKFCCGLNGHLAMTVNGTEVWKLEHTNPDWQDVVIELPVGTKVIRWIHFSGHDSGLLYPINPREIWLDSMSYDSSGIDPPGIELAKSVAPLVSVERNEWQPAEQTDLDEFKLISTIDSDARNTILTTLNVESPGILSYRWRSSDGFLGWLHPGFGSDSSVSNQWHQGIVYLGVGVHQLAWSHFSRVGEDNANVELRMLKWTEVGDAPIAEALDAPHLAWTLDPDELALGLATPYSHKSDYIAWLKSWAEVALEGPAEFSFRSSGHLEVHLDDRLVYTHSPSNWTHVRITIPPGNQRLRLSARASSNYQSGILIDDVRFSPGLSLLYDTLDHEEPNTVFLLSSTTDSWQELPSPSNDGIDALWHSGYASREEASFHALFPSAGKVSYMSLSSRAIRSDWVPRETALNSDRPLNLSSVEAIDQLKWDPDAAPTAGSLSEGLDTAITFTSNPEAPWSYYGSGAHSHDKIDHVRSASRGDSWLQTNVEGPAIVRFWWRGASSQLFSVNGLVVAKNTGSSNAYDWKMVEQRLPAGQYTLRWTSGSLDQFEVIPRGEAISLEEWAAQSGLPLNLAHPMATPAGDGTPNLLKFAFGLDPWIGADSQEATLPKHAIVESIFGDRLHLEFFRRKPSNLQYEAQFSSDLVDWNHSHEIPIIEDLGNGWERVIVPDRNTVTDVGMRSGRVLIHLPAPSE